MADPIAKVLIAFALLASLLLCSHASSDVPFIVAHKKASLNRLKSGAERVSVTIDIYNQGTSYVPIYHEIVHIFSIFNFCCLRSQFPLCMHALIPFCLIQMLELCLCYLDADEMLVKINKFKSDLVFCFVFLSGMGNYEKRVRFDLL